MLRDRIAALILVGIVALTGCGKKPANVTRPLTVEEWKAMAVDSKYTAETFERLKDGDPKLQTDQGWMAFGRTTLFPARKRDFPKRDK